MSAYFYDSSAISKHDHPEMGTDVVDGFLSEPDSQHYISRLTIIEIHSVFARRVRMRDITEIDFVRLLRRLRADIFRSLLGVVRILDEHYGEAERLLRSYSPCGRSMPCNSQWPSLWHAMAGWIIFQPAPPRLAPGVSEAAAYRTLVTTCWAPRRRGAIRFK